MLCVLSSPLLYPAPQKEGEANECETSASWVCPEHGENKGDL